MTIRVPFALLLTVLMVLSPLTVSAVDSVFKPEHPQRYTVVPGDTLWGIAARFLEEPWLWPEIWHANPEIKNPHLIYPGDVIVFRYVEGEPRLSVERGRPTVKLSPKTRVSSLRTAIPTIPINAIQPFLIRPRVMKPEDLVQAPYVVDIAGEHVIGGAGNQVYVRAIHEPKPREFTLVRSGTQYTDPDSDETLGFEATYVGDAYLQVPGDPATFLLLKSTQEVIAGDRLLPAREAEVQQHFLPRAPDFAVNGRIISVLNGMSQIGQYHVVVLNRGAQEGLEAGHVLAVYQTGETIRDPISGRSGEKVRLPDQRAGILMVFRTFERVSYGLVMEAQKAIHLLDSVRTP